MSQRETIIQAIVAALAGTTGVGDRIFRSRVAALAKEEFPALLIEAVQDEANRVMVGRLIWTLTFTIHVMTRTGEVDASADPIISDVHSKIMGDATLDGLVVDLTPVGVDWNISGEKAETPVGNAIMQFRASYQTDTNSLS